MLFRSERFDVARDAFERAIALQQALAVSSGTPQDEGDLARTLYNRGLLRFEQNDIDGARQDFEQSIATSTKAIHAEPDNGSFLQGLARCRINLGVLFRNAGQNRDALAQYDAAIATLAKLAVDSPGKNEYAVELAQSHLNRGNLLLTARNEPEPVMENPLTGAQASFEAAVRVLDALKLEYPNVPQYHIQLANALNGLGGVQQESGNATEAQHSWTRARAEFLDVLRLSGDSAEVRSRLGLTLANLALLVPRDQPQQRIPLLREACEHQRAALEKTPQAKPIKTYLRSHLLGLSRANLQTGEHAEAAAMAEELAALDVQPDDWRVATELIVRSLLACRDDLSLAEPMREVATDEYARRAVAILRRALQQGTASVERLESDEKITALRNRPEFQTLLQEFGRQASPN